MSIKFLFFLRRLAFGACLSLMACQLSLPQPSCSDEQVGLDQPSSLSSETSLFVLPQGTELKGAWYSLNSGIVFCMARARLGDWTVMRCDKRGCSLWDIQHFDSMYYLFPVPYLPPPKRLAYGPDSRIEPLSRHKSGVSYSLATIHETDKFILWRLRQQAKLHEYWTFRKEFYDDLLNELKKNKHIYDWGVLDVNSNGYKFYGSNLEYSHIPFFVRVNFSKDSVYIVEDFFEQVQYSRTIYLPENQVWALNASSQSLLGNDLHYCIDTASSLHATFGHCRSLKVGTRPDWVLYTRACEPAKRGEQVLVPKQLFQLGSGQILVLAQAKADLAQHYLYELDHEQDSLIELHRFRSEAQSWVVGYYPDSTGALFSSPETSECLFYDARQGARSWLPPK